MLSRSALVLVVVAIAEFIIFLLAATQVPVLLLTLAMAAVSVCGVVFLFRQAVGVVRSSVTGLGRAGSVAGAGSVFGGAGVGGAGGGVGGDLGDHGMRVLAGLLLAFPGLLTGLVGGLLLAPPVRNSARPVVGSWLGRLVPLQFVDLGRAFRHRGEVLDVDARRKDSEGTTYKTAAPPELR